MDRSSEPPITTRLDVISLVDKQVRSVPEIRRAVAPSTVEVYNKRTDDFIEEDLPTLPKDVTLVDFDPFGSPGHDVQNFFKHYKVTRPVRVAVTDGYALRLGLLKSQPSAGREVYSRYLTSNVGDGGRENQVRLLDNLMRETGSRHGFKARRIAAGHGDAKTIYAGYSLSPD